MVALSMIFSKLSVLAVATLLTGTTAQNNTEEYFEELERFWSYGRSPPVYPSRRPFLPPPIKEAY